MIVIDTQRKKYVCKVCGYTYDPEQGDPDSGIKPGTPVEDLPDDWVCPMCGAPKSLFVEEGSGYKEPGVRT